MELNKDQKKHLSEFLNSLAVAWFSAGAISPLFIKIDDIIKLSLQVSGSIIISALLFLIGMKNLATRE